MSLGYGSAVTHPLEDVSRRHDQALLSLHGTHLANAAAVPTLPSQGQVRPRPAPALTVSSPPRPHRIRLPPSLGAAADGSRAVGRSGLSAIPRDRRHGRLSSSQRVEGGLAATQPSAHSRTGLPSGTALSLCPPRSRSRQTLHLSSSCPEVTTVRWSWRPELVLPAQTEVSVILWCKGQTHRST